MDRDALMAAIRQGPIEVSMNDGQKLAILGVEFCVVDDIAAHILYRAEDGSWKTKMAALVCMATIAPLESAQVP